jgi:hypothetical protein
MPWAKGTVVSGAKGNVYLYGNTATAEDYDPISNNGGGKKILVDNPARLYEF